MKTKHKRSLLRPEPRGMIPGKVPMPAPPPRAGLLRPQGRGR